LPHVIASGAKIGFPTMDHARATLKKVFADSARREGGGNAPLLIWPLACGAAVAGKTKALSFASGSLVVQVPDVAWRYQLQCLSGQYLSALNQISSQKVNSIKFVLPGHDNPAAD
jgi:hypothetical protein